MAGATKCYKVYKDEHGNLQKKLVSHSPKYATKIKTAVDLVRGWGVAYVNPTQWQEFEQEWNK